MNPKKKKSSPPQIKIKLLYTEATFKLFHFVWFNPKAAYVSITSQKAFYLRAKPSIMTATTRAATLSLSFLVHKRRIKSATPKQCVTRPEDYFCPLTTETKDIVHPRT